MIDAAARQRDLRVAVGESAILAALTAFALARLGAGYFVGIADAHLPVLFGFAGAAVGATRFRRAVWWGATATMIMYLLVAFTPAVGAPARTFIRNDAISPAAPPQAIAVLSAGVNDDGLMNEEGSDRLLAALALARRWGVRDVILSRVRPASGPEAVTSEHDQRFLVGLADSTLRLHFVDAVGSTRDEAVSMMDVVRRGGWTRVALVTSPFHTKRACGTFERAGLPVICVSSESRDVAAHALSSPEDRIRTFALVAYEALGVIKYRAKGWL